MTIDEILSELSGYDGYFPKAAIEAAIEQKEAITPHLLAYLQELVDMGEAIDRDFNDRMTLPALFLLAQFREANAYPLIVRLVSDWEGCAEYHLGDAITEGLGRILASVCHGDTGPIKKLVEDNQVDEYVRSSALHSLMTLYSEQVLSRDDILAYYKNLFRQHPVREPTQIWNTLVLCSASLRLTELLPDIRQAYQDGLASPGFAALSDIEEMIQSEYDDLADIGYDKYYITDTVAELQHWAAFMPRVPVSHTPVQRYQHAEGVYSYDGHTAVRTDAKTGRNEPCPCGSGKKFKKCCGR
ncbi:DUF1186 family protein [Kistimonas scapharcae]|uniref:DUF1186 family protein n=1 Tax=Kistimonas scapharcae TaxID=1036133 RepID=A0ABP8UY18_9GAMM